ncbi:hypothetical protein M9H61_17580 [Thalassospira sp. GO-4]|uniref:NAD(P)-dependent oxidoreductase n=1 Tax=Thalassospira sp. GO-4 TaxID=2946605 RepID=UPI002025ABBF|nr:NAD(P)-dependent oxidoreductase [Thalassospira sp. GO-4]URK17344.1 hypothetical protein M9H61_17580 [Thalassospira sp. GO-4]
MRPRILNLDPHQYSDEASRILEELGDLEQKNITRDKLLDSAHIYDVVIGRFTHKLDREFFERATNLKVVGSATTGLDHIDIDTATRQGVRVLSLKGESEFLSTVRATPEHTLALLLAVLRRIPAAHSEATTNSWNREKFRGAEIFGSKVGLVGFGRVGQILATYFNALGAIVGYYDIRDATTPINTSPSCTKFFSITSLIKSSNIVICCASLNEDNVNLFDDYMFSHFNSGTYFINTARGQIVDEDALLTALRDGRVSAAGVDVLKDEFSLQHGKTDRPLLNFARENPDRLLITPHISGATFDSMHKTEIFIANKIKKFFHENSVT